ncbi:RNA polymerase sigma factor [Flagellimonas sp. 389]|uniref:RNA polymerase sigma factor n=1 Tax=Flagellimonas sp. 389 TaxID=2835862 RepID=UPI001BD266A5|nr:RNA polymerase sigma factor [Flagellimonas sp. 389]MBS9463771.1 RNA polymerase sigma factor [Flagellimonas sp. 389]
MKTREKVFDGLVVLEYQSGNRKSLSILVKRHHVRLCKHSYRYTYDVEASKDIVQDSWRTITSKLYTLKNPNSFSSWATRIVTRKSLDYLSKLKRNRKNIEGIDEDATMNDAEDYREPKIKKLLLAIKELPENQQMVLRLFYLEEYSLSEIGNILEISVGTAKSRLFYGREKLKELLKTKG